MAIYNVDALNEEFNAKDYNEDILDNLVEACDNMLTMLDESTAVQRHYGYDTRSLKQFDDESKKVKSGRAAENAAKATAKSFHSGQYDKRLDKLYDGKGIAGKLVNKITDNYISELSDREKEEAKIKAKAMAKGGTGYVLSKMAKTGADIKGAYDKAAEKADKKKAIKETCLHILSVLDEI